MERNKELETIKNLIKENFEDAHLGMYFTPNIIGDPMSTLHKGEFFTLKICYSYEYYELFGCTEEEEKVIEDYYKSLRDDYYASLEGDCMDFTDIKAKLTAAAEENKRLADEKEATIEQIGQICRDNVKSIVIPFVKEMNSFIEYVRKAPCGWRMDYEYKRHNLTTDNDAPDCYEFSYMVGSGGIDLNYTHNGSGYWSKQFTHDSREGNPQWESQHIQYVSNWFGTEERCQELVEILAKEYADLFSAYEQHFAKSNAEYAEAIKDLKEKLESFHAIKTKEDGTVEIQLGGKTYIGTLKEQE